MPASWTLVRPSLLRMDRALSSAARLSSSVGFGTTRYIMSIAASTSTPLGLPSASRSILPPLGSGVSRVMPASCMARLLAQPAWPSTRCSHAGRLPTAASSSLAVGKRPSFQISWFQPNPFNVAHPDGAWLIGFGWNQEIWKLGRFPTASELDAAVGNRPAWLHRVDGHAGWANSRARQLAGITRDTPDPSGGKIERDADGNPSGVLVDAAMDMMDRVVPRPTEAESRAALDSALAMLSKDGLTSVHDAGIDAGADALYRDYADHGKLTTRVYAMIGDTGADFDALSKNGPLASYAGDRYALAAVKLYGDGALGSRGAALLEPYSDMPSARGTLFHTNEDLLARMDKAMRAGYQVNVHAIGDAANRQVLDSFETLIAKYHNAALRPRIEHAQVVALSDIPRFKQLGVMPSMQPTHATSDQNMAEQRIGHERMKGAYAWRTFLAQG